MKPILAQIFTGLFLLLASQAFGQPTMTTNFVVTQPAGAPDYPIGTPIVIELRVTNFTNIESMQFPITYNKAALRFDSLNESVFSNWSAGNYVSLPAAGKITISWDGYTNGAAMPFSFPNGTAIFKLHFTSIGNGLSIINISGSTTPPIDLAGVVGGMNGQMIILNYQSGGTPELILGTGNPPPPPLVGFKIVANPIYIPPGERGCMPVTVNDFDGIQSMQWVLHWDKTVLTYECTRRYGLSGLFSSDINEVPSGGNQGNLVCAWADPVGNGVTLTDGARIVDVCFKAIGAPGASSTITIDSTGLDPTVGYAEAYATALPFPVNVWTNATHPNGTSGVSAPVKIIVATPPPTDVTYTVDKKEYAPNTVGCVAVKVKNFGSITSSEFALSYNHTELTYASVQYGTNPLNLQVSNITHVPFNPANPTNPAAVKFFWVNANGATVTNDSSIFSVCFTVIAPAGTTSNISFTSTPCPAVTGIGTAKALGGVSMASANGWIKSTDAVKVFAFHVNCNGGNTGSLTIDNGTGPTPTGYSWAGPGTFMATSQNIAGLAAGTYTVTVTYAGGNTVVSTNTITQPPVLDETHIVNTVSCFNGSNGAINLTPTGGTAPYTFAWAHGSNAEDPAGLPVGVYTVTITDAKGCSMVEANIIVSGFVAISLLTPAVVTPVTCAGLSTGGIEINPTGGAGNYTYDWSHNGPQTPDTDPKNLTGMPAGAYTVTVTDGNGCTMSFPAITITAPQPLVIGQVTKTDVKCFGTPTGTATAQTTGGTGTYSYCWSTGVNPCASLTNPASLGAGTYTLIVTDQNGCTTNMSNVVIMNPPSALSVTGTTTPSPCFEQASGGICTTPVGGWGNYTYAWTGPIVPPAISCPSNIPGGQYTVTVTDGGQCTVTQSFTVTGAPAISANTMITHVSCFGVNNGGINLNLSGGNLPHSVVWSNTTLTGPSIGNLTPGAYQPTVTDGQGCTKIFAAIVVNGPAGPINTNAAVITEANQNGGAIDLNPAGGTGNPNTWFYSWTGPNGFTATTQDISGPLVVAGNYTVTITDSNACTLSFIFAVPEGNVVFNTVIDSVKNACNNDGCFYFTLPQTAANQKPFTINWGFGSVPTNSLTPSICGLSAGPYSITVTAANGNSVVLTTFADGVTPLVVIPLQAASVDAERTNPFDAQQDGTIELTPTVTGPLTYQWGAPINSTSNLVTGLDSGLYVVTITNSVSGCTSVRTYQLKRQYPNLIVSTTSVTNPNCGSVASGAIDLKVTGGNDPYEYSWTGPNGFVSDSQDITGLMPGFYSVTVTDYNDTIKIQTFNLTSLSNLAITNVNETSLYPSGHQVSGANMCDGEASVVFIAGVGNTSIVWSNGVTGIDNSTLCGGAYSVTVTDVTGCSSVWTGDLTAPPAITPTQASAGVRCFGDCNGTAKVFVQGGFAPYKVEWSTGQTDPAIFPNGFSQAVNLCGGDYTVTITDKNFVEIVYTVNVPEPAEIVATFEATTPRSFNACDGELLIDATGAVAPITYVWSGSFGHSGTGERADNLCAGEFVEFYITDANGCTAYVFDTVPFPEDGCFRVSPVLTPGQQDGKNDNVYITCIETTLENHIEIYNRWGQLVFQTDGYTNQDADREHNWNGLTDSGASLAEGVYYYVLTYTFINDLGQQIEGVRKGAINLLQ
ncbi:MAG: gliding motility-associated C-terminal domain-containing protein [Saprospiraceae bacterium]|nr:gliding motility-associated C-terminal domain-containing protein [Saprospiraceae bacterium]